MWWEMGGQGLGGVREWARGYRTDMSLRLRILLQRPTTGEARVVLQFDGDRADLAALALAEWLSEEVPELLTEADVHFDKPSLN